MIGLLLRRSVATRAGSGAPDLRLLAFARGLALGALVGAAIAGSGIWNRRRRT
ncbi:MAG: hypothetical protein ABSG37_06705 [Candidatus Limnocylindrales bacterium]